MALRNLARMTTATTGTGTITLGSAVSGFLSFADAGVANGETVTYSIRDGANSEIGRGVYTTAGTTLSRATIYNSTNGGAAINLTGSGTEVFVTPSAQDIGAVVQRVNTQTGTGATNSTTIPYDDTIPQNTEGSEYFTQAITPKNTSNILYIDVTVIGSVSSADYAVVALFQDTTANALAAAAVYIETNTAIATIHFRHKMTAGTTSATTFKVRVGTPSGTAFYLNGRTSDGQKFGGVAASSITIDEVRV
jgi:hypothetical protein